MPNTLPDFFAVATHRAMTDLVTALFRIPEDKRQWSPGGTARHALDQIAECVLLNGYTADLIHTRHWATSGFTQYEQAKSELDASGWDQIHTRLQENTQRVIEAIRTVPEDALNEEIELPGSKETLAAVIAFCYWNMSYHQGQINYLASILGCRY